MTVFPIYDVTAASPQTWIRSFTIIHRKFVIRAIVVSIRDIAIVVWPPECKIKVNEKNTKKIHRNREVHFTAV